MYDVVYVADGQRRRLLQAFETKEAAMVEVRALWAVGLNAWAEKNPDLVKL